MFFPYKTHENNDSIAFWAKVKLVAFGNESLMSKVVKPTLHRLPCKRHTDHPIICIVTTVSFQGKDLIVRIIRSK